MEITYKQSLFNVASNDTVSLQWWPILVTKNSTNNTHDVVTLVLQLIFFLREDSILCYFALHYDFQEWKQLNKDFLVYILV